VTANRMNREQFLATLAPLDQAHLTKVLWNLYWRGGTAVRQRIETEIQTSTTGRRIPVQTTIVDPADVRGRVDEFVALARAGAYLAGDRRVTPKERTRWRHTFRELVADARQALATEDPTDAAAAMEALVDLACQTREYDYFRSEDPIEAAKVVISDEVGRLWKRTLEHRGFAAFAAVVAAQLIRWESRHGWTRSGYGQVAQKETPLATVLAPMLGFPDAWTTFSDCYLHALDQVAALETGGPRRSWGSPDHQRHERTGNLAEWHLLLLHRLVRDESHDYADGLATHPALGGPELTYLKARLADLRGETDRAHSLVRDCLTALPGHTDFLDFAITISAPLPSQSQQIAAERKRRAANVT
jgi:hypothetical protein